MPKPTILKRPERASEGLRKAPRARAKIFGLREDSFERQLVREYELGWGQARKVKPLESSTLLSLGPDRFL
jgi:hypothetical protein